MIEQLLNGGGELRFTRPTRGGQAMAMFVNSSGVSHEVRVTLHRPKGQHQATLATYRTRAAWTVEELTALGLPLYWSREWLLEQLTQRHSQRELALISGYKLSVLRRWKERHKIVGNPRYDMIVRDYDPGKFDSFQAAARHYSITAATLKKILKLGVAAEGRQRRVHAPRKNHTAKHGRSK